LPERKAAFPEFARISTQTVQDVIHRVDISFQRFFDGLRKPRRVGYPHFNPTTRYHSCVYPQVVPERPARLDGDGTLYLSEIGNMAVVWSRPVQGLPQTITIIKEGDGWYLL
jgi:putative transposase